MDRDALQTIAVRHQAEIYRYLRYLGADRSAAEDLVQETFLAAFRATRHPDTEDGQGMSAWLRAVARNMFLRYCRGAKKRPIPVTPEHLEEAETVWAQDFLGRGDGFDYVEALRQCLETVPPKHREALDMRYRMQQPRSDMAQRLGMTEDGVKSLLRRIRAALAECVQQRLAKEDSA